MFNFVLIAFLALLARHCESQNLVASDRPSQIRKLAFLSQSLYDDEIVDCNSLEKLVNDYRINSDPKMPAIPCHSRARLHSEAHVLDLAAAGEDGTNCGGDFHLWHSTRFTKGRDCQKNGDCQILRHIHGEIDSGMIQGPGEITIPVSVVTDAQAVKQWSDSTVHNEIMLGEWDVFGCFNGNVHTPTYTQGDKTDAGDGKGPQPIPTKGMRKEYTHCNFFKLLGEGENFTLGCPFCGIGKTC